MVFAGGYPFATLCSKAVVDDERKSPKARRRNPCDKQHSTAAVHGYIIIKYMTIFFTVHFKNRQQYTTK